VFLAVFRTMLNIVYLGILLPEICIETQVDIFSFIFHLVRKKAEFFGAQVLVRPPFVFASSSFLRLILGYP
jgi:hypothetical protein